MMLLSIILFICVFASFANNAITASAPGGNLDVQRSKCMCGKETLRFRELIPLLSYLLLGGKCSHCSERIHLRYFIVEFAIIVSGVLLLVIRPATILNIAAFLIVLVYSILIFTDFLYYRIPNIALGILVLLFSARLFLVSGPFPERIAAGIAAMLLLWGIGWAIENRLKKTAIGMGDIKLIGALFYAYPFFTCLLGIWCSAAAALAGIFMLKKIRPGTSRDERIPFGTFLALIFLLIEIFRLQGHLENIFILYAGS